MSLQTKDTREEYSRQFLLSKGWELCTCASCGKSFYVKQSSKMSRTECGRNRYDDGYEFKTLPKKNHLLKPVEVKNIITGQFVSSGYEELPRKNIINQNGLTDLIVAGVQVFDGVVHRGANSLVGKFIVGQPSIRTQFQPLVENQDGTSTAFVNICTEEMNSSIESHMDTLDCWFSALSKLGLRMDDFTIVQRIKQRDWGTGSFDALELFLCYNGLELGDAAIMTVPTTTNQNVVISDIGFGLERVTWAINKTETYFDLLKPITSDYPREMLDLCRSSALLSLDGVTASKKGAGLQLRRFIKILVEKYYSDEILNLINYYVLYWKSFSSDYVSDDALNNIQIEIDRFINLKICEMLKIPPPRVGELTEAYCERLVYAGSVNVETLRQAIQSCKK